MLLVLYNANAPLRHTMIPMTDAVYIVEEDAPVCNAVRRLRRDRALYFWVTVIF
ncbi:MAG: hypothetical protein ACXWMO_05450 [Syntrophales bacterium]